MPRAKKLSLLSLILVLALIVLGFTKAQAIGDWYRLRGYTPDVQITQLASQDNLSAYGTHILYVTHPKLESNPNFSSDCPQSEQTIVLGCYRAGLPFFSSGSDLFVKVVNDPRLNGVEEVTLAHEMLHAAYDRMGGSQKNKVDAMLLDYYNHGLTDQRIIDTLNAYKQSEPNDVVNEMHSIFGTEIANLPAPLENYYKQYFTDRKIVTSFADNYENEFTSRSNQIKADDQKLSLMKQQISQTEQDLANQLASIQADRVSVERTDDQAQINSYNARVTAYNSAVHALQVQISQYNSLVDQRNLLAAELRSLQSSLDSRLVPQASQ